jgi:cleavage and polyadenylation specificity factor subunit 1
MLHTIAADVVQPSCVHGAISGRFRFPDVVDLLLVKHNVLELYEVLSVPNGGHSHRFVSETRLNAPPVSVTTLRAPTASRFVDRVVLLVSDIHVAVCRYDAASRCMASESLFQLDDATEIPLQGSPILPPVLRIDPLSRVMLVLSRRKYLFLIPIAFPASADGGLPGVVSDSTAALTAEEEGETSWGDEDDEKAGDTTARTTQPVLPSSPSTATVVPAASAADNRAIFFGPVRLIVIPTHHFTLRNIRDMQFVSTTTSSTPTVAFLCEPTPTWAGRVKLIDWGTGVQSHALSCAVAWYSVELAAGKGLVPLGEVDSIPYNATTLQPFSTATDPSPAVICFAANSIHHVTSKRSSGFFFNTHGSEEAAGTKGSAWRKLTWILPKKSSKQSIAARVNLNCSGAVAVSAPSAGSNKLIVATESGNVFHLVADSDGRVVHGLSLAFMGQTSHASCIVHVPQGGLGVLFIGSASGDSHIFSAADVCAKGILGAPIHTFTCLGPILDADVVDCTTIDKDLVTAAAAAATAGTEGGSTSPYDALLKDLSLAAMAAPTNDMTVDPSCMDLLLCSGKEHTGALHVCRQSLRPRVALRQNLDSISVFFLDETYSNKRHRDAAPSDESQGRLLLVGTATSTIVVTVGNRMMQVRHDSTSLVTKQRTLYAAVCESFSPDRANSLILQVTENGLVQLLPTNHRKVVARRELGGTEGIRFATHDPETGHIFVITQEQCLFVMYLSSQAMSDGRNELEAVEIAKNISAVAPLPQHLLSRAPGEPTPQHSHDSLFVAVTATGSLLLFHRQLQARDPLYVPAGTIKRFASFPTSADISLSLHQSCQEPAVVDASEPAALSAKLAAEPLPSITELLAVRLSRSDPILATVEDSFISLFCLCAGEMVVYALRFHQQDGGTIAMNFMKQTSHAIDAEFKAEKVESIAEKKRRQADETRHTVQDTTSLFAGKSKRLVPFDNIAGMNGVFVCGKRPRLFVSAGDRLVSHVLQQQPQTGSPPLSIGVLGAVRGFSEINSPLLDRGFVVCGEGSLSFASLDIGFDYTQQWATRRVPVGGTPYFAAYSHSARSVFAVVAQSVPFRVRKASFDVEMRVIWNDDGTSTSEVVAQPDHPVVKETQGRPIPAVERYSIFLISVADWSSSDKMVLDENEQVLCAQLVGVNSSAVVRGEPMPETVQLCAVGTGYPLGEDISCRGRLLIVTSSLASGTRKIRVVAKDETKGPVTALASIRSHIAAAVGATIKLYRMDWEAQRLVVSAFLYAGVYVPKMVAIKNFLVFGDIVHSCSLARFNERELSLQALGRHNASELSVLNVDVLYRDSAFGMVATDAERRLVVLGYTPRVSSPDEGPETKSAASSRRLIESSLSVDAEYRVPSGSICKTLRLRCPSRDRPVLLYLTTAGAIGFLSSVSEYDNHTVTWITRKLVQDLPHHAGLNPKAFLSNLSETATTPREAIVAKEKVADGALLKRFADLGWTHRAQLALTAGTRAARVMNVIFGLQQDTSLF